MSHKHIHDEDTMINQVAVAIKNNAWIRDALADFVRALDATDRAQSQQRLRRELVMLAAGIEASTHDVPTFEARVQAAKNALAAWDGH
jgi:hypothetical protein